MAKFLVSILLLIGSAQGLRVGEDVEQSATATAAKCCCEEYTPSLGAHPQDAGRGHCMALHDTWPTNDHFFTMPSYPEGTPKVEQKSKCCWRAAWDIGTGGVCSKRAYNPIQFLSNPHEHGKKNDDETMCEPSKKVGYMDKTFAYKKNEIKQDLQAHNQAQALGMKLVMAGGGAKALGRVDISPGVDVAGMDSGGDALRAITMAKKAKQWLTPAARAAAAAGGT